MIDELRNAVTESLDAFSSLYWRWQMAIMGGVAAGIFMTIVAWKVMIPFLVLGLGVTFYLRRNRGNDSL
jgi:hypothetical protein